jgi:hypothetical protein
MRKKPKHSLQKEKASAVVPKGVFSLPCPNCDAVARATKIDFGKQYREVTEDEVFWTYPGTTDTRTL